MSIMETLKATMYDELDAILEKDYMTTTDLDLVYKIIDILKDVCEIEGGKIESAGIGYGNENDLMVRVKRMIDDSNK